VQLQVFINSGDNGELNNKEAVISIVEVEGHHRIQYMHYKQMRTLKPDWVSHKHPNTTHSNGLLVVIKMNTVVNFVNDFATDLTTVRKCSLY
jgi:hypothetical protein